MSTEVEPSELLDAARNLLGWEEPETAGLWPRAAALLARQALEEALDEMWRQRAPGVEGCSMTAQLLCLGSFLGEQVAEATSYVWWALTRATHHHPYELSPTADELQVWLEQVEEIVTACRHHPT
jgi:hypothetical protein